VKINLILANFNYLLKIESTSLFLTKYISNAYFYFLWIFLYCLLLIWDSGLNDYLLIFKFFGIYLYVFIKLFFYYSYVSNLIDHYKKYIIDHFYWKMLIFIALYVIFSIKLFVLTDFCIQPIIISFWQNIYINLLWLYIINIIKNI
jgi:hypothetical protein